MNKKEANLQISGMTCAACANRIEKGLKKVEGVHDANVNFALEKTKNKCTIQRKRIRNNLKRKLNR